MLATNSDDAEKKADYCILAKKKLLAETNYATVNLVGFLFHSVVQSTATRDLAEHAGNDHTATWRTLCAINAVYRTIHEEHPGQFRAARSAGLSQD